MRTADLQIRRTTYAFYFSAYLAAQKHPRAMSDLALQLIAENKRTKNPYLDLGPEASGRPDRTAGGSANQDSLDF
jgi:hypothetical protein